MRTHIDQELRHRLYMAREAAGLTRAQMAESLGRHPNTILNFETGRSNPTKAVVKAWARVTDVSADWLLTGELVGVSRRKDDAPSGGNHGELPGAATRCDLGRDSRGPRELVGAGR